ncbi:signal peptidase I [Lachnospiraceae bacterium KM106-2]|nr:signal peptidase I [Lachnospiraceae bacterium KM106-2]
MKKEPVSVKKASPLKQTVHMIAYFLSIIVLALLINTFVIGNVRVEGGSMLNTLKEDDRLVLEKITYYHENPSRYDIVVFKPTAYPGKYFIKRVIGLPGETIQVMNGDVYINGKKIKENYLDQKTVDGGLAAQPIKLGEDEYFVMGDNREISRDSRREDVGLIHKSQIQGKVVCRFWPLSKMGSVK